MAFNYVDLVDKYAENLRAAQDRIIELEIVVAGLEAQIEAKEALVWQQQPTQDARLTNENPLLKWSYPDVEHANHNDQPRDDLTQAGVLRKTKIQLAHERDRVMELEAKLKAIEMQRSSAEREHRMRVQQMQRQFDSLKLTTENLLTRTVTSEKSRATTTENEKLKRQVKSLTISRDLWRRKNKSVSTVEKRPTDSVADVPAKSSRALTIKKLDTAREESRTVTLLKEEINRLKAEKESLSDAMKQLQDRLQRETKRR